MIRPVRVGSFNRVPIFLGLSWMVLLPVVGFGLFVGIPMSSGSLALRSVVAGAGGLLVLLSIVVHELAHVVVAHRHAVPTERMLINALGGYSEIDLARASPAASIRITLAAPAVSAAFGGLLLAVSHVASAAGGMAETLGTLGAINIGVAVFNVLPAVPLDGGRTLHAWARSRGRSVPEAGRMTARAAALVGVILIVAGGALSVAGSGVSLLVLPVGVVLVFLSRRSTSTQAITDII